MSYPAPSGKVSRAACVTSSIIGRLTPFFRVDSHSATSSLTTALAFDARNALVTHLRHLRGCILTTSFVIVTAGCAGDGAELPAEDLGISQSGLTQNDSLRREATASVVDVGSAVLAGLDTQLGYRDQGNYSTAAYANVAKNKLGVHIWQLKDSTTQQGSLSLDADWSTAVTNMTRVRIAALGPSDASYFPETDPDRFVVATRESAELKLRSFFTELNQLDPKSVLATGESINLLAVTPVYPSREDFVAHQFATASTTSSGQLKVITWLLDGATGTITRKSTILDETVTAIAAAAPLSPPGLFVTAAILPTTNDLRITTWNVASDGTLTKGQTLLETGELTQVSASAAGYRRIAVAYNDQGGSGSKIATFEVTTSGAVTKVSEANLGAAADDPRNVVATSGNAGRVFVAGSTSTGGVTTRSLETIQNLTQIASRVTNSTGRSVTSATVLKGNRLIVAAATSSGNLELSSWRDYYSPLARGSWSPTMSVGAPADSRTETPFFPSYPSSDSLERLIAASPRFVVTCGTGRCSFNDKAGNELGTVTMGNLFASLEATLHRNIEAQLPCNPELPEDDTRCPRVDQGYDSRLLYAQEINRFIIVTQFRHRKGDQYGRHLGFAVSKDEDPRLGFYVYANLESIYRDSPQAAAAGGVLVVSHNSIDDVPLAPGQQTLSLRPAALVLDLESLATNATFIRNTKITSRQGGSGNNHTPIHLSTPRVTFNPSQIITSDLSVVFRRGEKKFYAFWKDVEGPVSTFEADFPASMSVAESGNVHSYETLYTTEVADGIFEGYFYNVGRSSSALQLQRIRITLQRGVGFLLVEGSERNIPCAHCIKPTTSAFGTDILIAYNQGRSTTDGFDAKYMYLTDFDATPEIVTVKVGDSSAVADNDLPQNYLAAADVGNGLTSFNGFWFTNSYSSLGLAKPVQTRVLPR